MENQEQVAATPRQMIHLQVAGNHTQEELVTLIQEFSKTLNDGGVIATPEGVVATVIQTTEELSGLILTPKMTALEIANIVVQTLQGFDVGQGDEPTLSFAELEQEDKVEIMQRIQCVMRLGGLPPTAGNATERTRDAIFVATVRALGVYLTVPNPDNLITVTKVGQKEGSEDQEVKFNELVPGDLFKHGENTFIAESAPYVNWINNPLPAVTIDAKVYETPAPVAPEDAKVTSTAE